MRTKVVEYLFMSSPSFEKRAEQYGLCGTVLAETARGIGIPVHDALVTQWEDTMAKLAVADDISEAHPEIFSEPKVLVSALGLDPAKPALVAAAQGLLIANAQSRGSLDLDKHFDARADEARYCADLLRYQNPIGYQFASSWKQIEKLSVAGIYLDSLFDAREDARDTGNFTAGQLATGAVRRMFQISREIRPTTYRSFFAAANRFGVGKHVMKKALRVVGDSVRSK